MDGPPRLTAEGTAVEAAFNVSRPVAGVRCYLRSQSARDYKDCESVVREELNLTLHTLSLPATHSPILPPSLPPPLPFSLNIGSSGVASFEDLKPGGYALKVHAYNRGGDVATAKSGFVIN